MLYIQSINGTTINIIDTDDNAVDTCSKDELKEIMLQNPDLVIRGVAIKVASKGIAFKFVEYKLSEAEVLRLQGAKSPTCKFEKHGNISQNYYYCPVCNKPVDLNSKACSCGQKFIWNSTKKNTNKVVGSDGSYYYYMSVNGLRAMERDRLFR